MSLPDIILSLLREPMSGTDLIGLFRGTIQHFWNTDLSQIYRSLEGLERQGFLRSESQPSARGPARRVYTLTRQGRRRLAGWLREAPRTPAAKFEYLAQLFSVTADESPRDRAREVLRAMRPEAARAVAVLEAIEARFQPMPGYPDAMPAPLFYPWLTLRHGLLRRRALLEWIDECLARLDRRPGTGEEEIAPEALAEISRALRLAAVENPAGDPPKKKKR